jgi:hypothetical protein
MATHPEDGMEVAPIAAAGITAMAIYILLAHSEELAEKHARSRTQLLSAARWIAVAALSWLLMPAAQSQDVTQRPSAVIGLAALIGFLMLIPLDWVLRVGGSDAGWQLRTAKLQAAGLANEVRRDPFTIPAVRIRELMGRIEGLRSDRSDELCTLLIAELQDLLAGAESWNEAGRRAIRMDQLSRQLWPDQLPPPELDPDEATFRWQMYRTFGELMDIGVLDLSDAKRDEFQDLLASLEDFRRPDTSDFISDVRISASRWLSQPVADRPWIPSFDFRTLGPHGLDEVKRIWGRDAILWGARLTDDDRRALAADLQRRVSKS